MLISSPPWACDFVVTEDLNTGHFLHVATAEGGFVQATEEWSKLKRGKIGTAVHE